jgi:hypothetical protein
MICKMICIQIDILNIHLLLFHDMANMLTLIVFDFCWHYFQFILIINVFNHEVYIFE